MVITAITTAATIAIAAAAAITISSGRTTSSRTAHGCRRRRSRSRYNIVRLSSSRGILFIAVDWHCAIIVTVTVQPKLRRSIEHHRTRPTAGITAAAGTTTAGTSLGLVVDSSLLTILVGVDHLYTNTVTVTISVRASVRVSARVNVRRAGVDSLVCSPPFALAFAAHVAPQPIDLASPLLRFHKVGVFEVID